MGLIVTIVAFFSGACARFFLGVIDEATTLSIDQAQAAPGMDRTARRSSRARASSEVHVDWGWFVVVPDAAYITKAKSPWRRKLKLPQSQVVEEDFVQV
jgi:hypothetical protein